MSDHPIQLALRGLSAGYTGREVLRDIQLEVRRGEILTLIGPNGAGKSTLLHTICGQLAPLRGEIEVRTRDFHKLSSMTAAEIARQIAVVFTQQIRPEHMTCREVVEAGRYPYTGLMGRLRAEGDAEVVVDDGPPPHSRLGERRHAQQQGDGMKKLSHIANG